MKTCIITLYLLTFCSLSHCNMESSTIAQTEKGFEASKEFIEKLSLISEKLAAQESLNKVKAVFKVINKIDKLLPLIGFAAPLVSFAFSFIDQDTPELMYMKQKFAEVNNKLASISNEINFLERNIDWAAYASSYAVDQNNIVNSWGKLNEFMQSIEIGMSEEDRARLANQFLTFYESTATENSVANLYRYVTDRNPFSLNKNLLTLIIEKTSGDMGALQDYSKHFAMLMVAGLRLNLYYYQTKRHSNTALKIKETVRRLNNFNRALLVAGENCANGYERWAKEEAQKVIADSSSSDDTTLAESIQKKLNKKFDWFVWSIVVHDITATCNGQGRSIDFEHGDKKIHMIARAKGQMPEHITWPADTLCSKIQQAGDVQYIHDGEVGGEKFNCVVRPGYPIEISVSHRKYKTISAFLTAKPSTPSCMCENGQCVQIKDSNVHFCKCESMYHGSTCNENIEDIINISVIQKDIYNMLSRQIVPDVASVYFKLGKIEENCKNLSQQVDTIMTLLEKCNI